MRKVIPESAVLIPDSARRVFEGQIFDVYQWPQQLFDGSTATFEMLRRPDTVVVLAVKDGKLVVIEDEQPGRNPRLTFPGGRVDEGEEWLAAAQRELLEETGLSFKQWRLVQVVQPTLKLEWFVATFVAFDLAGEVAPAPGPGERITVELVDFAGLQQGGNLTLTEFAGAVLNRCQSVADLTELPGFEGQAVER